MARYHGRNARIYISTTGTGAATALTDQNEWSIQKTTDKPETTSFEDANITRVQGHPDVQGKIAGFWNDTVDTLFTGADSADGVKIYIYPSKDVPTKYHYGPAFISIDDHSGGTKKPVSTSVSFVANGSWGWK